MSSGTETIVIKIEGLSHLETVEILGVRQVRKLLEAHKRALRVCLTETDIGGANCSLTSLKDTGTSTTPSRYWDPVRDG